MTKDEAINEIGNRVYEASLLFEELEGSIGLPCNGHHQAQEIARYAQDRMKKLYERLEASKK